MLNATKCKLVFAAIKKLNLITKNNRAGWFVIWIRGSMLHPAVKCVLELSKFGNFTCFNYHHYEYTVVLYYIRNLRPYSRRRQGHSVTPIRQMFLNITPHKRSRLRVTSPLPCMQTTDVAKLQHQRDLHDTVATPATTYTHSCQATQP
ncbi:hypothetical protein PR048_013206 [Dryococelus australis]|uniref:Uncharacterized protein n=1 Tax=Dryococelus australis TaxID=614101 RepID=A0ABQ9HRL5_9NEOP|nr:hypothetical protein PR048_013206 [Dryococelus australis]